MLAHLCTWSARGGRGGPVTLCLIPLRQGLSLNLLLAWHPADPSDPSVSALHSTGVTDVGSSLLSL